MAAAPSELLSSVHVCSMCVLDDQSAASKKAEEEVESLRTVEESQCCKGASSEKKHCRFLICLGQGVSEKIDIQRLKALRFRTYQDLALKSCRLHLLKKIEHTAVWPDEDDGATSKKAKMAGALSEGRSSKQAAMLAAQVRPASCHTSDCFIRGNDP